MALSFRFATEADIPALVKLRLAVDADQELRFGKNRWSTSISERSVARGLRSSRVLVATHHGRIIGALRMETKKPPGLSISGTSRPSPKRCICTMSTSIPGGSGQAWGVSSSNTRKRPPVSGPLTRFGWTRTTARLGADLFTPNADSRKWAAQSIEVFHLCTSNPCLEVSDRTTTKISEAAQDRTG